MGPKPIQDVAPPEPAKDKAPAESKVNSAGSSTEQSAGPEIVHDIPVRQPTQNANYGEGPLPGGGGQSPSFIESIHIPEVKKLGFQLPHLDQKIKDNANPAPKAKKSSPVLASVILLAAMVCLTAGAYLKFVATN